MASPSIKAIFHRQIPGDHALLELARLRFRQAGLGPEYYPTSPEELQSELRFHPEKSQAYTVHLPRDIRVLDRRSHDRICAFAAATDVRAIGLVVHDQPEVESQFHEYAAAARELDRRLHKQRPGPLVFIEYAAGLEPATFVALHEALSSCHRISACVDISHIGIRQCQREFERLYPGKDVCRLKSNVPELEEYVKAVQAACKTALPTVLQVVTALAKLGKLLHFHLHDGHPASTYSQYGVSDHLSFFREVRIPFSHRGRKVLPTLYGPLGLREIIATARMGLPDEKLSFTLEIHAPEGRQSLDEYEYLFRHWQDRTNAERMQFWLDELLRNHQLLAEAVGQG